ncbi:BamA/TamA family outer membrane protein [Flammeovirga kamogawensis]|uniref:BamA/TamA family outer membrane protein n=1 Tax=Flammeovirga kamogawensis TaxID=373891 RepID=A0ABX8GSA7_9BACT|nr:BamA/TamA family outer membrane protein [Flammeovirga kamogawensis]MBB6463831.1 outer membrane protein assembly factor BamA [Flammeovirga kamogawensis]QWG06152.1 BamA/TamA family outer membrane protein [Flammeovirga kamogawensis]TRX67983.1 BamA/TamA family outer membrane protein [Flammeovirga kamogawensis]
MNKKFNHIENKKSRVVVITTLLLLFTGNLFGQETYTLEWELVDDNIHHSIRKQFQPNSFKDSLELKLAAKNKVTQLSEFGYLLTSVDTILKKESSYKYVVFIGPKLEVMTVDTKAVNMQVLKGRYWKGNGVNKEVRTTELSKAKDQIIRYYEDRGYPFASTWIDSISFNNNNKLQGVLKVNLGDPVVFDTLIVKKTAPLGVHKKFFEAYLGLKKGEVFRQRNVDRAEVILKETPYLKLKKSPKVVFEYGKAMVEMPIEKRKASRADGMLGFAPNSDEEGGLLLTGQVLLDLRNPFGTGKKFYIDWKKPDNDSQWFNARYEHPRIFRSRFDFGYSINLQKQDSTFLMVNNGIDFSRKVSIRGEIKLGANWESSRLLREISEQEADTLNDTKTTTYSVGYKWQNLDDPLAPRRGIRWKGTFSGGQRTIIYNPSFDQDIYEGIQPNSAVIKWQFDAEYYFGMTKWLDGYLKIDAAQMIGDHFYKNELYRIGGFRSLRGFNEGELYVDRYAIFTAEPRINIGGTSFIFLFADIAITGDGDVVDLPLGIGAGVNIETRSGDFSIAYALGRTDEIALNMDLAKIHFGFIGKF